jgi:putative PIN family toxin of toxin-antitoxin system
MTAQAVVIALTAVTPGAVVIDTNIVLDVFVFSDPATAPLKEALAQGTLRWMATLEMRSELARVLAYPQITLRLAFYQLSADAVLAQFDRLAQIEAIAPRCSAICKDPDDQRFINLAVAHKALLLSKDKAVLCMRKRLLALGVSTRVAM